MLGTSVSAIGPTTDAPAPKKSIDDRVTGAAVASWHLLDRMGKDEPLSWQLDDSASGSGLSHNPLLIKNLSQLIKCPRLIKNPGGEVDTSTVEGLPQEKETTTWITNWTWPQQCLFVLLDMSTLEWSAPNWICKAILSEKQKQKGVSVPEGFVTGILVSYQ